LGKVLAAYQDWDEIEQNLLSRGMPALTERTLVTPQAYRVALEETRAQKFAIDDREYNNLVSCVAAPIRDMTGQVVAGVSISTVGESVDSLQFKELATDVKETAGKLSRNLGYQGE
jgi:IclR family acetate operon transcriptional repressor